MESIRASGFETRCANNRNSLFFRYTSYYYFYPPPENDGGSSITSYTATSIPESYSETTTQLKGGSITVTGLDSNSKICYTFTVKATNAIGTSLPSEPSNPITTPTVGDFYQGGVVFYIATPATDLDGDGNED